MSHPAILQGGIIPARAANFFTYVQGICISNQNQRIKEAAQPAKYNKSTQRINQWRGTLTNNYNFFTKKNRNSQITNKNEINEKKENERKKRKNAIKTFLRCIKK